MLDSLFEDIGKKIKSWAKAIFVIEALTAIITGFVLLFVDEDFVLYGLLTMVIGPIVAWVSCWILYGFGELIDKVCDIAEYIRKPKQTMVMEVPAKTAVSTGRNIPASLGQTGNSTATPVNGWVCTCGRTHQNYEVSCICGVTKHEAKAAQPK